MARHDPSEMAWRLIEPLLPNRSHGMARVDDRRVFDGIFYVRGQAGGGAIRRRATRPAATMYDRFTKAGMGMRMFEALSTGSGVARRAPGRQQRCT